MATIFKGLISLEMLAQMPLPFVHRLRDIRIKQMEAKRRQQEIATSKMSNIGNMNPNAPANQAFQGLDESAIEDIVDELT